MKVMTLKIQSTDIHKRQFMNKEKTIAYCGSLVQQNHGEELGHGYLRWDVPTRKSTYVEIPNDYGYYTLDIENGKVTDDALKLIVKISEGSVRDALSLLDRALLSLDQDKELDLEAAQNIFGYFDKSVE